MSELPWFRMYHEFATDPKVQMLSEADQRRFIMVLCIRCCNGDVTVSDDAIAFQLRISGEEWAATKARLIERELIDQDNKPAKWAKRQQPSDSSKSRVSKFREKAKRECNGDVTAPKRPGNATDTDTDKDIEIKQLPLEQEAARESEGRKFDLKDVGCGLGGEPTPQARRAVARQLGIADPQPLVDAWLAWPPSRKAKSADAHFRASARTIFANLSASEREACGVIADLDMKIKPVAASPQLVARLARSSRHAH